VDQNSAGFMYLESKFPRISETKIKEVNFLILDVKFEDQLGKVEKVKIIQKCHYQFFGGNRKAEKYCDMVADLVQSYKAVGCNSL
jgi:hypothetical protein